MYICFNPFAPSVFGRKNKKDIALCGFVSGATFRTDVSDPASSINCRWYRIYVCCLYPKVDSLFYAGKLSDYNNKSKQLSGGSQPVPSAERLYRCTVHYAALLPYYG